MVPETGIEPVTRGFSILGVSYPTVTRQNQ